MLTINYQGREYYITEAREMTALAKAIKTDESVAELQAMMGGKAYGAPLLREQILRSGGLIKSFG